MARWVSKVDFAKRAGVTKQALTLACRLALAPATSGTRIDIDHPAAVAYIARHRPADDADPTPTPRLMIAADPVPPDQSPTPVSVPTTPTAPTQPPTAAPEKPSLQPEDYGFENQAQIDKWGPLTVTELVTRFGTFRVLKDWLDAARVIETVREKRLSNAEKEGKLISRELVHTFVLGAIEAGNLRLLQDVPQTLAAQISALVKAGATHEELEREVRETLSKNLKQIQAAATKALRKTTKDDGGATGRGSN